MFVEVNGLKAHYIKGGNISSSKTIVLIHGSNMCAKMLESFFEYLPEYNVIIPDIIGHGDSEGEAPKSIEEGVSFFESLLFSLKEVGEITDDVFVGGYSLGGCISTEIGIKNLPFVTGIGVFNSCDFKNTGLDKLVPESFSEFDIMSTFSLIQGQKNNPEALAIMLKYPQKEETAYNDLYAASKYDTADYSEINVPVLFVTGEDDKLAKLENILELYKKAPTGRLHVIPFRGHSSFLEVTEDYAQSIIDILEYGKRN